MPFHLDKKIPKILYQKDPGWKDRGGEDVGAKDFFRFSQVNKSHDFGRMRARDDISYLKNANDYVKEVEAEKQRKKEERIWIEVKTIEEQKARERERQYREVLTVEKQRAKERQERITQDTQGLPSSLTKQYKTIKQLKKDIKKFLGDTESLSAKFIADMEVEARKDRAWQMKLEEQGLA